MRHVAAILILLAGLVLAACSSGNGYRYTGTNPHADEGAWIKDPEAVGVTRDVTGRRDTTRTASNRVDIPVGEFVQVASTTRGQAIRRNDGFRAGFLRLAYGAGRYSSYVDSEAGWHGFLDGSAAKGLHGSSGNVRSAGFVADDTVFARSGRADIGALSAQDEAGVQRGALQSEGLGAYTMASVVKAENYAEASTGGLGYGHAFGARIIGLHLWKYADRNLAADAVEVTYTIVYYNTNDRNTGPTEIIEPVPYYTEYVANSATLPNERSSVEFVTREGARTHLRWAFPQGIAAGETGEMKYKVRVQLDARYAPPEQR